MKRLGPVAALLTASASISWTPAAEAQAISETAFIDVSVLPMDSERVLEHRTVLVRGGMIAEIGPAKRVVIPPEAARIEGHGSAWLLPGLADMHTHVLRPEDFLPYTANGVTTILHMGGAPADLVDRAQQAINSGEIVGPQVFFALMVDGTPSLARFYVRTPEQARAAVQLAKANGYSFIKVYNNLTPEEFAALVDEGRKEGLAVIGHGVRSVGLPAALFEGQVMVAHGEEFFYTAFRNRVPKDPTVVNDVVEQTYRSGAFVTPNLSTFATIVRQWGKPGVIQDFLRDPRFRYMSPDERLDWSQSDYTRRNGDISAMLPFLSTLTKAFADRGVPLLTGTDSPVIPGMLPGYSIHEDLDWLLKAGLSPFQALSAATRTPGEFIAKYVPGAAPFGEIRTGMRADLVLVSANPLKSLTALEHPIGVMSGGRWRTHEELDDLLTAQKSRYEAVLNRTKLRARSR